MDKIEEKLYTLKDEFFNSTLETKTEDNASINNILKIKDVDDSLKETLVLLTNNYTAELQAIRHHQIRSLIKIIDTDIEVLNKYKEILKELESLKEDKKLFTFKNISKWIGGGLGVILFMVILYHFEPVAVDKALTAIKDIVNLITRSFINISDAV